MVGCGARLSRRGARQRPIQLAEEDDARGQADWKEFGAACFLMPGGDRGLRWTEAHVAYDIDIA